VTLVEACVTSVAEATAASSAGAGRLELCRSLEFGGLTPDTELVHSVRAETAVPLFAMVRPHAGGFVATIRDIDQMLQESSDLIDAGAEGIVLGVLGKSGHIDEVAWIHSR